MFVKMKLITILIYYMHIRAQSWNICGWFGKYPTGIVLLFCLVKSHPVFVIFHTVLAIFSCLIIKLFNFIPL